jgi:hypothetical protein
VRQCALAWSPDHHGESFAGRCPLRVPTNGHQFETGVQFHWNRPESNRIRPGPLFVASAQMAQPSQDTGVVARLIAPLCKPEVAGSVPARSTSQRTARSPIQ